MTDLEKVRAVMEAAADLVGKPHCWTTPSLGLLHDDAPSSTKRRCLFAHLAGMKIDRWKRMLESGFTRDECYALLPCDEGCATADEMYERAVELCDRLWPEPEHAKPTFPIVTNQALPQDMVVMANVEHPQGMTAFERLEEAAEFTGYTQRLVDVADLRAAVELARCYRSSHYHPSSPGHALFEART
jgi:hypothetical protein